MLTEQEQFWRASFGTEYTKRNAKIDWRARVPFWRGILAKTDARSVLEVGCNSGANLKAIRMADPAAMLSVRSQQISLCGVDINQAAIEEAGDAGLSVVNASLFDLKKEWPGDGFDLVATVGVLIHVSPADLPRAMDSIISVSNRYVLAVEYPWETEVAIPYRDDVGLWKRPFGKLYQERGLSMVAEGEAPADAFDRCYWWLLSK